MNALARDWQLARARAHATLTRLFDESKHPRDPKTGEFTETGGTDDAPAAPKASDNKEVKAALGKDIAHPNLYSIREKVERGAWNLTVEKVKKDYRGSTTTIGINVPIPSNWIKHTNPYPFDTVDYYDPSKVVLDEDGRTAIKIDTEAAIPKTATPGVIYRGMSWEEYQGALKNGHFKSRGDYNLGEAQVGLTYYSSDPGQAVSYAHGFAPSAYKAVPGRPAVVVGVADPGDHYVVPAQPTELGIRTPVPTSAIREVYFGEAILAKAGYTEVIQESGRPPMEGSGNSPSVWINWRKEGDDKVQATKEASRHHPGEGYTAEAYIANGVIYTDDVYDAARAIQENRAVELDQPRTASLLITELGKIAKNMIAHGEQAPTFNLCKVTIKGTSLFCADSAGIPRVQMPQLTMEQDQPFFDHLKSKGYTVERQDEYASYLHATQNELNGAKVAGIAAQMRTAEGYKSNPIFVSQDNYILDGHHRWAAEIGVDADDNVLANDKTMAVWRVNISITRLLEEAEAFTGGEGKLSLADEAAPDEAALASAPALTPEQTTFVREWSEAANWTSYQHAAAAVVRGTKPEDYICYDCVGDDKERYAKAERMIDTINASPDLATPLYRGLTGGEYGPRKEYKVGDRFSESLTSWTSKKELAEDFAGGAYAGGPGKGKPEVLTLDVATSVNSKGVNVSDNLPETASAVLREAGEYLTTGEYEVTAVNGRDVTVRRVGPAVKQNLKKSLRADWLRARARAQCLLREFDESKHPRDPKTGEFSETGGSGGDEPKAKEPKAEKPAKGISSQPSWPKEDNGTAGKGDEILVYRSESTYSRKFEGGTNAGNADGMAASFVQKDAPGMGDKIAAYRVRLTKDIAGKHTGQATGWERDKALEGVARDVNGDSVTYHFPATGEGYTVEKLGYVSPFPGLWKKLREQGLQNPPEAGQAATADAIRAMFNDPGMVTAAEESEASEHSISHLKQPAVDYGRPFERNELAQEHYKNAEEYRVGGMSIASYKLASGKGDAYSVNRALRGKDEMTPEIQKYVDGLDLAFDRTAIPLVNDAGQPTAGWLYRGIRNHFDKYKVGQVVDDSGFVSTSVFKQFAEEWIAIGKDSMTGGDGTLVRITVPKGTKVVTIQNTQESEIADEGEVLLNRGTQFRVTKVDGKYIEMTVIP